MMTLQYTSTLFLRNYTKVLLGDSLALMRLEENAEISFALRSGIDMMRGLHQGIWKKKKSCQNGPSGRSERQC